MLTLLRRSCYSLSLCPPFSSTSPHLPSLLPKSLLSCRAPSPFPHIIFRGYAEAHNFRREKENDVKGVLDMARRRMNYNVCVKRLEFLQEEVKKQDFWADSSTATKLVKEKAKLERKLDAFESIQAEFKSYEELFEMGTKEKDKEMITEALNVLDLLHAKVGELELAAIMSDPADPGSCYLEIHAGAGGLEAMDWTSMLLKMYTEWAARKKFSLDIMHQNNGDVGIKSVSCKLSGDYAYGWAKTEHGIHRLIRVSPYDSNGKRHTSFAAVNISPIVDDSIDISLAQKDLKIETMRASGAGGQHVNKTESAVRITHIPTGITVHCATQRSQHQNKDEAMGILKGRIYQHEAAKRQQKAQENYSTQADNAWGSQIRTYTMHPGSRVKDQRTNYETSDVEGVLEGNDELDTFMKRALQYFALKDHPPEEQ